MAFLVLIVLFGVQAFAFDAHSVKDKLTCERDKFSSKAFVTAGQKTEMTADRNADVLHSINSFSFLSKEKINDLHFPKIGPVLSHHLFKLVSPKVKVLFPSVFTDITDCLYPYFFFF